MRLISKRLALNPDMVTGMGTAASMENAVVEKMTYKDLTVTVEVVVEAGMASTDEDEYALDWFLRFRKDK